MKPINNASGGVIISVRSYPIASGTKIAEGQVVKLSGGKVVAADAAETGAVLGIAVENHPGVADALNPRANGQEIHVADGPDLLFECAAPLVTATAGTATTVVTSGLAAFESSALKGGKLQLAEHGAGSTNADSIRTTREITNYVTGTFTIASGSAASAGDKFRVYPPIGFNGGNLNDDGTSLALSAVGPVSLRVVGHDMIRGKIILRATNHAMEA